MCGKKKGAEVKETAEQQALAQIAAERWLSYKEMYLPVEQQYFDYVDDLNSPARMHRMEGVAATNVESAFGEAVKTDIADLTSQGVDPTSGKFQTAISDQTEARAAARAENTIRTGQALQDAHVAGKQNIVAVGNNQSGQAIAGFGDVAQQSAIEAQSEATSDYRRNQGNAAAAGMVAGAGYGAYVNTAEEQPA